VAQGLHTQGSILASLSAMLPDADRTLSKSPEPIPPRRTVMECASWFPKEHVESIVVGDNFHPIPNAKLRFESAGNELETIAVFRCGRERMKPNNGGIVGDVELDHVVLPECDRSKHQTHSSRDNPNVSHHGTVTKIVLACHSDTVALVAVPARRRARHSAPPSQDR
jgi:hypothetical protein